MNKAARFRLYASRKEKRIAFAIEVAIVIIMFGLPIGVILLCMLL